MHLSVLAMPFYHERFVALLNRQLFRYFRQIGQYCRRLQSCFTLTWAKRQSLSPILYLNSEIRILWSKHTYVLVCMARRSLIFSISFDDWMKLKQVHNLRMFNTWNRSHVYLFEIKDSLLRMFTDFLLQQRISPKEKRIICHTVCQIVIF